MAEVKEVKKFIEDEVKFLMDNQDYVGGWLKLGNGLAVVVCWEDGFDPSDKDAFHAENNPSWCLCAGIKVFNPNDTPDYWTMLSDEEGTIITESTQLSKFESESKEGFAATAEWIVETYNSVKDVDYDDNGVVKSEVDKSIDVEIDTPTEEVPEE